jgi:hypothetical protein
MKRLTDEQVEQLRESCAGIAHGNWDGGCTIDQHDDGTLCFQMWTEEHEVETQAFATYEGEFQDRQIWCLRLDGEEPHEGVLTTLVPAIIVGYMSL